MNANDRGLAFFIFAFILVWLILDDFFGNKFVSRFANNIAGNADEAVKDAILENIPGGEIIKRIDDAKDAPMTKVPDVSKPENLLPVPGKDGKTAGYVKPGNYQTQVDIYSKPFSPPPWSGYGPRPGTKNPFQGYGK